MSRQPPPVPRDGKPDPDFLETLMECEEEARALRDKVATLMHLAPKDPAAWFATFTDAAVLKGLGSLTISTGKAAAWIAKADDDMVRVLNGSLPTEVAALLDHFVEGQVDAEVSCTCGDCVPCAYRNEHGVTATRAHVAELLRPTKKRSGLVDPRGRPLH